MFKKLFPFFVVTLVLLVTPVSADMTIEVSDGDSCVVTPHTFTVGVRNELDFEDYFDINIEGHDRWIRPDSWRVKIAPNQTETIGIRVNPGTNVDMGEYSRDFSITSRSNRSVSRDGEICFYVIRDFKLESEDFSLNKYSFRPGENVTSTIGIKNEGTRDFEEVTFTTLLFDDNDNLLNNFSTSTPLSIDERKELSNINELGKYQDPGTYRIEYEVNARGNIYSSGSEELEVVEHEDLIDEETRDRGILYSDVEIMLKNEGNVPYVDNYSKEISFPYNYLVSTNETYIESSNGGSLYFWDVNIDPGSQASVQYRVHYWPIYIFLILLLLFVAKMFFVLRKPKVSKSVRRTEVEEGDKIFTVTLEVKNRLSGTAKDVTVKDYVPNIARVVEKFDGLRPDIIKDDEHTELRWKLGDMDPGEERILHYKVRTLVEAVEFVKLPKAEASGEKGRGSFHSRSSEVKLEV